MRAAAGTPRNVLDLGGVRVQREVVYAVRKRSHDADVGAGQRDQLRPPHTHPLDDRLVHDATTVRLEVEFVGRVVEIPLDQQGGDLANLRPLHRLLSGLLVGHHRLLVHDAHDFGRDERVLGRRDAPHRVAVIDHAAKQLDRFKHPVDLHAERRRGDGAVVAVLVPGVRILPEPVVRAVKERHRLPAVLRERPLVPERQFDLLEPSLRDCTQGILTRSWFHRFASLQGQPVPSGWRSAK